MVRTAGRTRPLSLSPIIGAVVLCVLVSVFIALPSTWGGPTIDPGGVAISTSTGDALTAPHALAPTHHRVAAAIVRVSIVAILVALAIGTAVLSQSRLRTIEAPMSRDALALWTTRRRGPPALPSCPI